jgi:cytochrome c556
MAKTLRLTGLLGITLLFGALGNSGFSLAEELPVTMVHREVVKFPPQLREQFLANMRDHLLAVSQIQAALGDGQFSKAAEIAQTRLGIEAASSSACKPGMEHMNPFSQFMPEEMRKAGRKMHNAADQFARNMQAADYRAAWSALSNVTQACVGCHASYQIER